MKTLSRQFWVLSFFLSVVFLTGGSSRHDAQSTLVLNPLSIIICSFALYNINLEQISRYRTVFVVIVGLIVLTILHIIPLPSALWQMLPNRDLIVLIDDLLKFSEQWRPLTITPMNGVYSLFSLFTPLAIYLLAVQIQREELQKLLPLILILCASSGLLGVLQIVGDPNGPFYLYRITNNGSAVGLFANRNHSALLLVIMIPMLALYASLQAPKKTTAKTRTLLAVAAALVAIPLILVTGSRSGLLLLVIAFLGSALLYRPEAELRKGNNHSQNRRRRFVAVAVSATTIVMLGFVTYMLSRAEAVERLFSGVSGVDSRGGFWLVIVDLAWKYFPFGSGAGSFVEAYLIAEPNELLDPTYLNHAHNDWIELVMTMGLPGVGLLIYWIVAYIRNGYIVWRGLDTRMSAVLFGRMATIAMALIALASFSDYPLRTPIFMAVATLLAMWIESAASVRPLFVDAQTESAVGA